MADLITYGAQLHTEESDGFKAHSSALDATPRPAYSWRALIGNVGQRRGDEGDPSFGDLYVRLWRMTATDGTRI